jgi:hypothetical protein
LFTTASSRPNAPCAAPTAASTLSVDVTSSGNTRTPASDARSCPSSGRRIVAATCQPAAENVRTVALPIPDEAPVTRIARGEAAVDTVALILGVWSKRRRSLA